MELLLTIFYIIPLIICCFYLYVFWKRLDLNDNREVIFFSLCLVLSVLPVTNIIMAFIISAVFILSKNE